MLKNSIDELRDTGNAGDWCFINDDKTIVIRLPAKSWAVNNEEYLKRGLCCELPLRDEPDPNTNDWQWNKNKEAPTLTPSINWIGVWHGYLTDGKLTSS